MRTVERPALARATANGVPACPEPMTMAETTSRPIDIVVMKRVKLCRRWIGARILVGSRIRRSGDGIVCSCAKGRVGRVADECKTLTQHVAGFHIILALS